MSRLNRSINIELDEVISRLPSEPGRLIYLETIGMYNVSQTYIGFISKIEHYFLQQLDKCQF